jgi:hypothetical protein
MDETILTLHPQGKQGVNISRAKYDTVRAAIVATLQEHGSMTFGELTEAVAQRLAGSFDGSVSWYVVSVKLDLEARDVLRRVPNSRPQRIELTGAV